MKIAPKKYNIKRGGGGGYPLVQKRPFFTFFAFFPLFFCYFFFKTQFSNNFRSQKLFYLFFFSSVPTNNFFSCNISDNFSVNDFNHKSLTQHNTTQHNTTINYVHQHNISNIVDLLLINSFQHNTTNLNHKGFRLSPLHMQRTSTAEKIFAIMVRRDDIEMSIRSDAARL